MNRLKAYVRRTLLEAARDYANGKRRTPESTRSALQDALHGTDSGWWSDLIYTAPMLAMAQRYRTDIAAALLEYTDATGEPFVYRPGTDEETGALAIALACTGRKAPTWDDYRGENGKARESRAECMLIGLRFAVEWYAGEVAHDLCPDL